MTAQVPDALRLPTLATASEREAATRDAPDDQARAWAQTARLWLRVGRTDRAVAALEHAEAAVDAGASSPARGVVAAAAAERELRAGRPHAADVHAQAAVRELADGPEDELARALLVLSTTRRAVGGAEVDGLLADAARHADGEGGGLALEIALARATRAIDLGTPLGATRPLGQLAAAAEEAGDPARQADALTALGRALVDARDYARARPAHERALRLHAAVGSRPGMVASLGGLGLCKLGMGATADAAPLLTKAIEGAVACGDLPAEAAWRAHLDHTLVLLQRTEWRIRELRRYVEVVRALGDEPATASLLCELGNACLEVRDLAGAEAAHAASLAISEARGDDAAASIDHANLGWTWLSADRPDQARAAFRRALDLASPHAPHVPALREALGRLEA